MGLPRNETAIRDLDAEIDRISAAIQELDDKRRSLQTQRNSRLPFFGLAPEICVTIFSLACHKGRLSLEDPGLVTTPFVVSSVCHTWRAIARSAPELWRSVSLCVSTSEERSAIQADLLDQWLHLARALPLSISITFDKKDVYKWNPDWQGFMPIAEEEAVIFTNPLPTAVISVAASYSRQWESLDIFLPSVWAVILNSTIGHIPNLKSLSLQYVPYNSTGSLFSKTFLDAPKLRTVTLDCENTDVGFPCHQLEELTFSGYTIASRLVLLKVCSNLTSCRIIEASHLEAYPLTGWESTQPKSVHLSKLASLDIADSQPSTLLPYIVAPALKSITTSLRDSYQVKALSAFLTHSNAAVQRLSIINNIKGEEDFLQILDTLPHLLHLEFDNVELLHSSGFLSPNWSGPSQKFFHYLTTPNTTSGGLPLPALTSLKYRGRIKFKFPDGSKWHKDGADNGVDVEAVENMLLARWDTPHSSSGTSRLQAFSMTIIASPKAAADLERSPVVEGLRKEGMCLMFESVGRRPLHD